MLKHSVLILSVMTSTSVLAVAPCHGQDNAPADTRQTDQSEEDWRRSQKKKSTSRPVDIIPNISDTGWGSPQPQSPVDSLPEASRRHMIKERARILAETPPGQTPKAVYNLSKEAQNDPELAQQELEAWEVIMTDLKGTSAGKDTAQDRPNKVAVTGQGGGQPQDRSIMRGGSSASVEEILAQIKNMQGGGSDQAPGHETGSSTSGSSTSGSSEAVGAKTAQTTSETTSEATSEATSQTAASGPEQGSGSASAQNQSSNDNSDQISGQISGQSSNQGDRSNDMANAADNKPSPAPAGPLARSIPPASPSPTDSVREGQGRSTSALDYIKAQKLTDE